MTQKKLKPQIVEKFKALYLPQCHKGAMGNFKRRILHCMLQPHNALQWQGRKSHPSVGANFPFCPSSVPDILPMLVPVDTKKLGSWQILSDWTRRRRRYVLRDARVSCDKYDGAMEPWLTIEQYVCHESYQNGLHLSNLRTNFSLF